MEPFKSAVYFIPGVGFSWTGRDGIRRYVDVIDDRVDDNVEDFSFPKLIGEFDWSGIGLPERFRAEEQE